MHALIKTPHVPINMPTLVPILYTPSLYHYELNTVAHAHKSIKIYINTSSKVMNRLHRCDLIWWHFAPSRPSIKRLVEFPTPPFLFFCRGGDHSYYISYREKAGEPWVSVWCPVKNICHICGRRLGRTKSFSFGLEQEEDDEQDKKGLVDERDVSPSSTRFSGGEACKPRVIFKHHTTCRFRSRWGISRRFLTTYL